MSLDFGTFQITLPSALERRHELPLVTRLLRWSVARHGAAGDRVRSLARVLDTIHADARHHPLARAWAAETMARYGRHPAPATRNTLDSALHYLTYEAFASLEAGLSTEASGPIQVFGHVADWAVEARLAHDTQIGDTGFHRDRSAASLALHRHLFAFALDLADGARHAPAPLRSADLGVLATVPEPTGRLLATVLAPALPVRARARR